METTFNSDTSIWHTTLRQKEIIVDNFYTYAFEGRAPSYLAEQICRRTGHFVPPEREISIRFPRGKWKGKVIQQVSAARANEFAGILSLDEHWLKIEGDDVETKLIPVTSIRDLRLIGEKKELRMPGSSTWQSAWENSYNCQEGAAICAAASFGVLAAYTMVRPVLNQFIPTRRSLELIVVENDEMRMIVIRLSPGGYEQFAEAIAIGSKTSFTTIRPALGIP